MNGAPAASPFRQSHAVYAVAFACVVSFMGIGLVDPILPAISEELNATSSQVTLLFTSYLVVTAVAMLITGWVSSRIGAKRTLIVGLAVIVLFSALAGASGSVGEIVGFRAGWGVGNALFIATSLAVIVASASGGFVGAIILYEAALGLGIAVGPLLGGLLGHLSWRGPFFGVAALMAVALVATVVLVEPTPRPTHHTSVLDPLRALRHRGLLTMSLTAFCYNWAFFTILGYAPFLMDLDALRLGLVFTSWGLLVAFFSVFGAPRLQRRLGIARTLYANLTCFALVVLAIAIWTTSTTVVIAMVIVAGAFIGINNTVTTQAVMTVAPVERPVASASYGFVRFLGGGLAPFVAGKLVEATNVHVPFFIGAGAILIGIAILSTGRRSLDEAERVQAGEEPATTAATTTTITTTTEAAPTGTVIAAVGSTDGAEIIHAAERLAAPNGWTVDVLHAREYAVTAESAVDLDDGPAPAGVGMTGAGAEDGHLHALVDQLTSRGVPAVGHVIGAAADHGAVGRMIAEHAARTGARAIVIGTPTHGNLLDLMDASASRELLRHAHCDIVIVNRHGIDTE